MGVHRGMPIMGLVYCLSHDIDNNFYLRHCMSTTFQLHTAGLHLAMVLITTNIVLTIVLSCYMCHS